jgi:hypothetical protein
VRQSLVLLFAALASALLAGSATAAVLPVNGTLSISMTGAAVTVATGSGIGSTAGGIGSPLSIPAGLLQTTPSASLAITPIAVGLSLIQIEASPAMPVHGAGVFAPTPGGELRGAMGLDAAARFWVHAVYTTYYSDTRAVSFYCGRVQPLPPDCFAGSVPLKYIGGGGMGNVMLGGVPVTFVGAVWSNLGADSASPTRQVKLQRTSPFGNPKTITATAYDKRTAGGAGTVQLIAPVSVEVVGGLAGTLPIVGVLTLQFVPEPGTILLVGSGIVGLVAFGRTRRQD